MFQIKNIRKDSCYKNISVGSYCLPLINKLNLDINLKDIIKINKNIIIKMISLLEIISQQKPSVYFNKIIQKNKIRQKQININALLVLRQKNLLLFFESMNISLFSEMLVNYLLLNIKLENNKYDFVLKNTNVLKDLDSNFFSWKEFINLKIYFKNSLMDIVLKENKL